MKHSPPVATFDPATPAAFDTLGAALAAIEADISGIAVELIAAPLHTLGDAKRLSPHRAEGA